MDLFVIDAPEDLDEIREIIWECFIEKLPRESLCNCDLTVKFIDAWFPDTIRINKDFNSFNWKSPKFTRVYLASDDYWVP